MVIATPAAYAFSRLHFRGKEDLAFWILSNRFMPFIAVVIPIYIMMANLGFLDTYQGLVIPYVTFQIAFIVLTMRAFFDDISTRDRRCRPDRWPQPLGVLGRVMLPIVQPGLVTTAIFGALFTEPTRSWCSIAW